MVALLLSLLILSGVCGSAFAEEMPVCHIRTEEEFLYYCSKFTLDYRLALHSCRNYGSIFSHADYSVAVCGSSIGAIMNCEAYGLVSSPKGEYVGEITDLSHSEIRNCFSKCALSGNSYVGGIVGSGSEKIFCSAASLLRS